MFKILSLPFFIFFIFFIFTFGACDSKTKSKATPSKTVTEVASKAETSIDNNVGDAVPENRSEEKLDSETTIDHSDHSKKAKEKKEPVKEIVKESQELVKEKVATKVEETKTEIVKPKSEKESDLTEKQNSSSGSDIKTNDKSEPYLPPVHKEKIENVLDDKKEATNDTKGAEEKSGISKEGINKPANRPLDNKVFHQLLQTNVAANGDVDYQAIKKNVDRLDGYLAELSQVQVSKLSQSAQLAFWINAYNAFTIKKIVDNYPLGSITDLDGGKPWDKKWINLDGRTLSLNNIENDIIRPTFNEPRIHFAVNCAAKSCPPVLNKAWSPGNLNTFLDQQTRSFINDTNHNQISPDRIKISKIFEWYAKDFGNLIDFLNKYSEVKINANAKVEYGEYDWRLNAKK